jgi:glycine/D-amino acid oxidase-like deaminating enzyme
VSVSQEHTTSLWMNMEVAPDARPLARDETADVAVVGAGIAGLSTAYELSQLGKDVVLIDRGPIARGMTSRTTAHLVAICDDSFDSFIKLRGLDAKAYYESQSAAVDRIEQVQAQENIACNFRRVDGFLFPAIGSDPAELDPELHAARRIGVSVAETRGVPFKGQEQTRCLRYLNQATFHPLKYLRGLTAAIVAAKGRLYAGSVVENVEEEGGAVVIRTAKGHRVRAKAAVVATNAPINDRVAIHTKQAPYRTYSGLARNQCCHPRRITSLNIDSALSRDPRCQRHGTEGPPWPLRSRAGSSRTRTHHKTVDLGSVVKREPRPTETKGGAPGTTSSRGE